MRQNHNVFPLFSIQSKVTGYTQREERITYNGDKSHSIKTDPGTTEITELEDKNIKQLLLLYLIWSRR